eukprot:CAMPEP_0118996622 /NCGR_PEP_ID=MMETSP1173-20130426/60396_1 /TAXON_ID=1034831 /ORGANISM="Rhizochromulina marina cf, Strain CCMP1243" /LENGTH=338 /DNA_ID=CAMNT_0006948025 /DNA_START=8 /DNA_END=1020 /DNA_ORIENTATION=+
MAAQGMFVFMKAVAEHLEDTQLLAIIFELFGELAFILDNLQTIIHFGGLKLVCDTIELYQHDGLLLVKAMQTLDNLISAQAEYAFVAERRGVDRMLTDIMNTYAQDPQVLSVAETTKLSLQAQLRVADRDNAKTHKAFLYARLGRQYVNLENSRGKKRVSILRDDYGSVVDPLQEYREFLSQGVAVKVYVRGQTVAKVIRPSSAWDALLLRDEGQRTSLSQIVPPRVLLKNIGSIEPGAGKGHARRGLLAASHAKDSHCFTLTSLLSGGSVISSRTRSRSSSTTARQNSSSLSTPPSSSILRPQVGGVVYGEVNSEEIRDRLVDAVRAMLSVMRQTQR